MFGNHDGTPLVGKPAKYVAALVATTAPALPLILPLMFGDPLGASRIAMLVALGAYHLTSLHVVQENELAGIWVLQQRALAVGPGFYPVPRGIAELNKLPTSSQQDQFPADPEKISKKDDALGLEDKLFRPIRVTTAQVNPDEPPSDDPLATRLTLEVTFSVVWKLHKDYFFDMWERIPGADWNEKYLRIVRQMRDTGEVQIAEIVGQHTPDYIIAHIAEINDKIKDELQKALAKWGIEIEEALLQSPDFPKAVNVAIANVAAARANGAATITTARATREASILEADGKAEGRKLLAEAARVELAKQGQGIKDAATAVNMSGADYRAGEVAMATIGQADLVLGTEGVAQAMGLGRAILRGNDKTEKTDA